MNRRTRLNELLIWVILMAGMLGISGCKMPMREGMPALFVPPTLVATAFRTPTPDLFQPTPDPRANCVNNLTFIEDVTIPDGMVVQPGAEIVKKWKVQNTGDCDWNSRYSLRRISGDSMGAEDRYKLIQLQPGEEGIIEITFTAPEYAGGYYSGWQAFDHRSQRFGVDIYVEIYVNPQAQN